MRSLAAALSVLLSAGSSWAGPPSDGVYACVLEGRAIGSIRIAGETYTGLAKDAAAAPSAKFVMLGPDRIYWLGEMGDLTRDGYRVDHTIARDENGATAFDLVLLKPDQSGFVTASCKR